MNSPSPSTDRTNVICRCGIGTKVRLPSDCRNEHLSVSFFGEFAEVTGPIQVKDGTEDDAFEYYVRVDGFAIFDDESGGDILFGEEDGTTLIEKDFTTLHQSPISAIYGKVLDVGKIYGGFNSYTVEVTHVRMKEVEPLGKPTQTEIKLPFKLGDTIVKQIGENRYRGKVFEIHVSSKKDGEKDYYNIRYENGDTDLMMDRETMAKHFEEYRRTASNTRRTKRARAQTHDHIWGPLRSLQSPRATKRPHTEVVAKATSTVATDAAPNPSSPIANSSTSAENARSENVNAVISIAGGQVVSGSRSVGEKTTNGATTQFSPTTPDATETISSGLGFSSQSPTETTLSITHEENEVQVSTPYPRFGTEDFLDGFEGLSPIELASFSDKRKENEMRISSPTEVPDATMQREAASTSPTSFASATEQQILGSTTATSETWSRRIPREHRQEAVEGSVPAAIQCHDSSPTAPNGGPVPAAALPSPNPAPNRRIDRSPEPEATVATFRETPAPIAAPTAPSPSSSPQNYLRTRRATFQSPAASLPDTNSPSDHTTTSDSGIGMDEAPYMTYVEFPIKCKYAQGYGIFKNDMKFLKKIDQKRFYHRGVCFRIFGVWFTGPKNYSGEEFRPGLHALNWEAEYEEMHPCRRNGCEAKYRSIQLCRIHESFQDTKKKGQCCTHLGQGEEDELVMVQDFRGWNVEMHYIPPFVGKVIGGYRTRDDKKRKMVTTTVPAFMKGFIPWDDLAKEAEQEDKIWKKCNDPYEVMRQKLNLLATTKYRRSPEYEHLPFLLRAPWVLDYRNWDRSDEFLMGLIPDDLKVGWTE